MPFPFSSIGTFLNLVSKIKEAFSFLKTSDIFLKETDLYNLIENYFCYEELPQKRIKLIGKLSNYTLSNSFPVYTIFDMKDAEEKTGEAIYDPHLKQMIAQRQISFRCNPLQLPSISYKTLKLNDGSYAKVLWLYPHQIEGLNLHMKNDKLDDSIPLHELFKIEDINRPIPVLIEKDAVINQFLYNVVEIIGIITTAPISIFNELSTSLDSFQLNYFGNCFRPFTNGEAIFAIDVRKPHGRIIKKSVDKLPFNINYTVQGTIDINSSKDISKDEIFTCCAEAIPERQGLKSLAKLIHQVIVPQNQS